MNDILLDESVWFPPSVVDELRTNSDQLQKATSFEKLREEAWVRQMSLQLDNIARGSLVIFYYCAREIEPGYLQKHGLPLRTVAEHERDFLDEAWDVLSEAEIDELQAEWDKYRSSRDYHGQSTTPRVGLDRSALLQDAAGDLHNYCGTNIVHQSVFRRPPISQRLMDLGTLSVAVGALPGREIILENSHGLGEAALTHYLCHARSEPRRAFRGHASNGIAASNIRQVLDWRAHRYYADLTHEAQRALNQAISAKTRRLGSL